MDFQLAYIYVFMDRYKRCIIHAHRCIYICVASATVEQMIDAVGMGTRRRACDNGRCRWVG